MIGSWTSRVGIIVAVVVSLASFALAQDAATAPATSPASGPASRPAATAADITRWVQQLGDEGWQMREEAQERLIDAGAPAIPEVAKVAESDDIEIKQRAKLILAQIAKNTKDARGQAMMRNILWRVPLAESAGSAVAVGGGLAVFRTGDGGVAAVEIITGKSRWSLEGKADVAGGMAMQAPVIDGDAVLVNTGGSLRAVELATGKDRWQFDREAGVTQAAVADGVVFVCGRDKHIIALDAKTGQEVWQALVDSPFSTSPVVCGDFVLGAPEKGGLVAINRKSGKRVWDVTDNKPVGDLVAVSDETFLCRTGESVTLREAKTGAAKWSSPMPAAAGVAVRNRVNINGAVFVNGVPVSGAAQGDNATIIADGVIYYAAGPQVFAVDANSGVNLWALAPGAKDANGEGEGGGVRLGGGNIVVRGGGVLVIQGNVVMNGMTMSGQGAISPPCVHEGMLYVGTAEGLLAYDLKTRQEVWRLETKSPVAAAPVVIKGVLYFSTVKEQPNAAQASDEALLHAVKLPK